MAKAKDAFRTISEVAEWLDVPTHVLRFWESKFTQIKPVKGAGGRRYYRPSDMELLAGIKQLLHVDGLTIKGTQKLLREKGVKSVASLGQTLEDIPAPTEPARAATPAPRPAPVPRPTPPLPAPPMQDALPFDDPALDTPPDQQAEPRLLAFIPADGARLRAKAAQIAPLLDRLDDLRRRMAG